MVDHMHLAMAGLDFTTAAIATRERFSPEPGRLPAVLAAVTAASGLPAAIIATCNRTELYLSAPGGASPDPGHILCRAFGADPGAVAGMMPSRHGPDAVRHLMAVAGGLVSSVPGDDQIISQVRNAIDASRAAGCADPLLEAAFRAAVTAGKKIKTSVRFAREGASVAGAAVRRLHDVLGSLRGKSALVIGNGSIGRLAAALLAEHGCRVSVTVRRHHHGKTPVPDGCCGVDYAGRYQMLAENDILISATSSPHHTVTAAAARALPRLPAVMVDLAIPRDIEPDVGLLPGVTLWNVDDLGSRDEAALAARLAAADAIVAREAERFEAWRRNYCLRSARTAGQAAFFPVFIDIRGTTAVLVGGGIVAARRADVLLGFGAQVRLVAPELSEAAERLRGRDGIDWLPECYSPEHLDGAALAVAATDDRGVNARIGRDARARGIPVSVADRREECSFFFPAIVTTGTLTAGLVSTDGDHARVKRAARRLRQALADFEEEEA